MWQDLDRGPLTQTCRRIPLESQTQVIMPHSFNFTLCDSVNVTEKRQCRLYIIRPVVYARPPPLLGNPMKPVVIGGKEGVDGRRIAAMSTQAQTRENGLVPTLECIPSIMQYRGTPEDRIQIHIVLNDIRILRDE